MRQYEQTFANPLLAMAFKDGIDFVGDPDMKALNPSKATDGSTKWVVVIEDTNDYDDDEEVVTPIQPAKDTTDKPTKISFDEFRSLTRKNMTPKAAKREPGVVTIATIAEPNASPAPRGQRVIIPDFEEDSEEVCLSNPYRPCVNCRSGKACIVSEITDRME